MGLILITAIVLIFAIGLHPNDEDILPNDKCVKGENYRKCGQCSYIGCTYRFHDE